MKFFKKKKEDRIISQLSHISKIFFIVAAVLILGYILLWQTGYIDTLRIAREIQKQQVLSEEDAEVLKQLKTIIDLPEDVMPMIMLVQDAEQLKKEQPGFFAKAQKGDRVIVYPNLAILYDYQNNKIMHVGPVDMGQQALGTVSFALYNGTDNDQALEKFEEKLVGAFKNAVVRTKQKAGQVYEKTLVIDLKGDNPEIGKIAEAVGGQVAELPNAEVPPQGITVLIIVGQDQLDSN